MTTTRQVGLSVVKTVSQVSRSISTKEATGNLRIAATGRAVQIYFDVSIDFTEKLIHKLT